MNIDPRELHRFTPSRPDGVVCVTVRNPDEPMPQMRELCGYPAGHPIHAEPPNGDTPQDRGPYQDLRVLRGIIAAHVGTSSAKAESWVTALACLDRLGVVIRSMPDPAPPCSFKSAHSCRICGRWLEGEWNVEAPPGRVELQRQMDAGHCDLCHERVCKVRALAP